MIKIEDNLYDIKVAIPLIMSLLAFQESLPQETLDNLTNKPEKTPFRDVYKSFLVDENYIMRKK